MGNYLPLRAPGSKTFRKVRIREIRIRKNRRIPYTDTEFFRRRIRIRHIHYCTKHCLRQLKNALFLQPMNWRFAHYFVYY